MARHLYSQADRERVFSLRDKGLSRVAVQRITGITEPTIILWEKARAGLRPWPKSAEDLEAKRAADAAKRRRRRLPAMVQTDPLAPDPGCVIEHPGMDRDQWRADLNARLLERHQRLSRETTEFDLYRDGLGDPPPHRSALWLKIQQQGKGDAC